MRGLGLGGGERGGGETARKTKLRFFWGVAGWRKAPLFLFSRLTPLSFFAAAFAFGLSFGSCSITILLLSLALLVTFESTVQNKYVLRILPCPIAVSKTK